VNRSLVGTLELNGLFLLTGFCLLWALRGWRSWIDLIEHLGVALLLGLGCVCVIATIVLVAGGSLALWVIVGICGFISGGAAEVAILRRKRLPRTLGQLPDFRARSTAFALGGVAVTVAVLVAFFRTVRVNSFVGYDAWAFWIPKAKAIYFFGGLDEHLFRTLPGPSYPLLLPALQAMDFRFIGSADGTLLAAQAWLLLVAFLFAIAAMLRPFARPWLCWLLLASTVAIPELDDRLLLGQADLPLDMFFAAAALALVCWSRSREPWLLFLFGAMSAATFATKREGALLLACLLAGSLVGTARSWRRSWPELIAALAAAYALNIPWRLWWTSRHLQSDVPGDAAGSLTSHTSRIWPSFVIVARLLFTYDFWLLITPIALVAGVLSLTLRGPSRETAIIYLTTFALGIVGFMWILWSDPGLPLNTDNSTTPIPRVVGALVLLSAVLAPLLIGPLLDRRVSPATAEREGDPSGP
jgi:hypothetical protein